MLGKILTKEECARCEFCCSFLEEDIWECPIMTSEMMEKISNECPEAEYSEVCGHKCLKLEKRVYPQDGKEYLFCNLLHPTKGCMLNDSKPLECRLWPYRIMKCEDGELVLALSHECAQVMKRPFGELYSLAWELAEEVFSEAHCTPQIVRPLREDYTVMLTEKHYLSQKTAQEK